MPDEPPPPPPLADMPKSTGLPSNIAAALACIPLIGGIVFYVLEKHDNFVRFYAMQSIILGGAWIVFAIVYSVADKILTPIPVVGWFFSVLLWAIWTVAGIAFLVLWIVATVKAFTKQNWDIPYIGPIARKQVGEAS